MTPVRNYILILFFMLAAFRSSGWIYPEHRYIALVAIQKLSPEHRAALDQLWLQARMGYESRLTEAVIVPTQGIEPTQLDYASWTAIAGDHSCSPAEMMRNVLKTDWILEVADVAARLDINIKKSKNRSQHINALRDSDIRLQRTDVSYATRAGSNNVHFLLARPGVRSDAKNYLLSCVSEGAQLNALGAYSWFHTTAMEKASRYANVGLTQQEKSALLLGALADEAFALHFLEDVFAAGHTAGTWGEASVRKGTHDFYNEKGLEVVTWDGKRVVSLGDAFLREEDAELAAEIISESLQQIVRAASGEWQLDYNNNLSASMNAPDTFNVCKNNYMVLRRDANRPTAGKMEPAEFLRDILKQTPVPGLAVGLGEIPRFRSEIGKFFGVSSSLNGSYLDRGYGSEQTTGGWIAGIEANLRVGFGLDGVLNQAGDGLIFFQAGYRQDASSSNRYDGSKPAIPGVIPAALPGRGGYNVRLRLPFWLIPGDLLIAGPILYLINPELAQRMAVTAGNGGAIPWQSGIATPIGRFQFVLGREVGVSFYISKENGVLIPSAINPTALVSYSSTKYDFPFLEYRPFRTFSLDQTSSAIIQFAFGVDVPYGAEVVIPAGDPLPSLVPVWNFSMRLIFDWRHYL